MKNEKKFFFAFATKAFSLCFLSALVVKVFLKRKTLTKACLFLIKTFFHFFE
jgi:hypothetical protein